MNTKKKKNLHECQAIHEIIYINENLYLKSLLFCDLLIHHYIYTEESAYRVLTDEAPDGGHIAGIPKIIKAYELHKDNAEVVASIVSLVMELAEYGKYLLRDRVRYWQIYMININVLLVVEKKNQAMDNLIPMTLFL